MASLTEQKAQEIVDELKGGVESGRYGILGIIITIAVVLGIIVNSIQLWQFCHKTPAQALDRIKNLGILGRFRMRQVIYKELEKTNSDPLYCPLIMKAVVKVGSKLSISEMDQLIKENQNQ